MDAKDRAVEMCTLLSMKNSRALSISSQSTQDGGALVACEVLAGHLRQPVGQCLRRRWRRSA